MTTKKNQKPATTTETSFVVACHPDEMAFAVARIVSDGDVAEIWTLPLPEAMTPAQAVAYVIEDRSALHKSATAEGNIKASKIEFEEGSVYEDFRELMRNEYGPDEYGPELTSARGGDA